jgi:hypothetical protein
MKKAIINSLFAVLLTAAIMSCGTTARDSSVSSEGDDLYSDTWVATDALGRTMPQIDSVGPVKNDQRRVVGIFYITWHTQNLLKARSPYEADVTKVLHNDPNARMQADNPEWKYGSYHWGEPEMGYFLSQDEWVIRKDMSMLSDAGVDVLVMDVTNAVRYWDEWEVTFSVMEKMRAEGNRTPQFLFWCYNGPVVKVVQDIYERIYKENKYSDLWFYWDGKPLLLYNARPQLDANGSGYETEDYSDDVKNFFTLRNMWWGYYEWGGERYIGTEDNWSFGYSMADDRIINMTPEELASKHDGKVEECAVTPAQHPVTMTSLPMGVGKSWSRANGEPKLDEYDMPGPTYVPWLGKTVENPEGYGIYFQERWEDALAADPQFLYLNDWNEWTAGKYNQNPTAKWLGRDNPFIFVDQYNAEFNRTIQPMKGGYTDNYYMQMAQNIRRYKGVRPIPENKGVKNVKIDGSFADWNKVKVVYRDTYGDTFHRDAQGYAGIHYTDNTGRNDIIASKVALTKDNVCFYVETAADITPCSDPDWMLLLVDTDQNTSTGWYGYDLLINKNVISDDSTEVLKWDGSKWISEGNSFFKVAGNKLELSVSKEIMGVTGNSATFDFKWTDNPGELVDPISICTHGDTAPNRRFNYRFIWNK